MLVLKKAGLVYLSNPKTATQSLRAALAPFARATPKDTAERHINAQFYDRKWARRLTERLGARPETFAVMREPVEHLNSWYRYRQREALRGHENSTQGISFAEFVTARLSDDPPPFAKLGYQDRFLGFTGEAPPVNYIFDYRRLDLMLAFLSQRLGQEILLPKHNISPKSDGPAAAGVENPLALPAPLLDRLKAEHAAEFALYEQVSATGLLETPLLTTA